VGSAGDERVLKPRESHEDTAPLTRACAFTRPGRYEIQVSRAIRGDPQHRIVKSNKITLTVGP
jgi:hypothetical protein